ncbi:PspC domain-containing protein [Robertkochia sediminum]|uniref:PspC domain-containing protein n=1 Tax=Robertkochia sediminum TaxID=2785326 RepID=UPI0019316B74|nr:PspC domain-containing protein [Robertkochia sediminum]MBL7473662.1 PspC domain-containing protein [Robertkochia sediminum]
MNKTVNINLANTFFHIDEDAYRKLQGYLEAIKRSFSGTPGGDEIMADIEARIAELFTERQQSDRQVITTQEVNQVIEIMGQPEDYMVDEEIFADEEPYKKATGATKEPKKLFRDIDNQYVSGVSAGLAHYLGIDVLWIRLLFILTTVFSGFGIVAYVLFWVLVPEAKSTAEKLAMTGEPINITNIEKKIKEGIDTVTEKVKNVDYEQVGKSVKDGSRGFFGTLGNIVTTLFRVVGKFIGIILILTAASTLIALLVGLFTAGSFNMFGEQHWTNLVAMNVDAPLWLISLLVFFAVGIPFFFLFYLGLKIVVNNLNSLGRVAQFSLLALWILSLAGLISLGVQQTSQRAVSGKTTNTVALNVMPSDTLTIKVNSNTNFNGRFLNDNDFDIVAINGVKHIYSDDVEFWIRKSAEANAYVEIQRRSRGASYDDAFERAENVRYNLQVENNTVTADNYWLSDVNQKFRDQEVVATFYLPSGTRIKFDSPTNEYFRTVGAQGYTDYKRGHSEHIYEMSEDETVKCIDCEETPAEEEETTTAADTADVQPENPVNTTETDTLNNE